MVTMAESVMTQKYSRKQKVSLVPSCSEYFSFARSYHHVGMVPIIIITIFRIVCVLGF